MGFSEALTPKSISAKVVLSPIGLCHRFDHFGRKKLKMYVFVELLGGIALLLWGLRMVRIGVMRAYGSSLNRLAGKSEGKVLPAFLSGLFAAAMLQSSTATAMIAASFSARAVISVTGAFYIILGADIGTAIAVLLASQKIIWLAPALISIGVFGFLSTENSKRRSDLGLVMPCTVIRANVANE